jgi:hypothetical protein
MSDINVMQLRCTRCKGWFTSPWQFADERGFDTAFMAGNLTNCPHCANMVPCNKENVRWVRSDGRGGYVGNDTTG